MFESLPFHGIALAATALVSVLSWWTSKRTQAKAADREATEQALAAQRSLLDRYESRIDKLEQRLGDDLE